MARIEHRLEGLDTDLKELMGTVLEIWQEQRHNFAGSRAELRANAEALCRLEGYSAPQFFAFAKAQLNPDDLKEFMALLAKVVGLAR